jgi:mycobactin lysine-N-oxygenase
MNQTGAGTKAPTAALVVVGAGPKGCAIAAKARVLKDLQIADIEVTVIDAVGIATNWIGSSGYTDGGQRLGTPPEKDIAFPHTSQFGDAVIRAMLSYSWQKFLVDGGKFSQWIDRGRPHPTHSEWAAYLVWAFHQARPALITATVTEIKPTKHGRLNVSYEHGGECHAIPCDGVVFTGPGDPLRLEGQAACDSELVLNGRNYWRRTDVFAKLQEGSVAVIGSGETAASIVVSLLAIAPQLRIDVINRHGTLFTRGESYQENLLYSVPSPNWTSMDPRDRDEFIRRTDRGVFSLAAQKVLDHQEFRTVGGNVARIRTEANEVVLSIERRGNSYELKYTRAIVATGFDPLAPLKLLPSHMVPSRDPRELRELVDPYLRLPMEGKKKEGTIAYNLHFPMLAGFAQGPGFPNLSCLGTLSDRILSLYAVPNEAGTPDRAETPEGTAAVALPNVPVIDGRKDE